MEGGISLSGERIVYRGNSGMGEGQSSRIVTRFNSLLLCFVLRALC